MFDVEILRLCKLLNLRIKEVGVRWSDDGDSRYDPIGGTIRNMKELMRIRRMRYDFALHAIDTAKRGGWSNTPGRAAA
jgi:hypothetical protein